MGSRAGSGETISIPTHTGWSRQSADLSAVAPRNRRRDRYRVPATQRLLYLRQPGYGPSYIIGKLQLDGLLARASHRADRAGRPFVMRGVMERIHAAGILPPALIEAEMFEGAGE